MNIPEHILSTLTDEQKKKAEAVQTSEELLALAKEAGYDLTAEQLEMITGGDSNRICSDGGHCPGFTCGWNWK